MLGHKNMEANKVQGMSAEQILTLFSKRVEVRFEHVNKSLGEIQIRKFPSRLEADTFIKVSEGIPFDKARTRLIMSNGREEWSITLELVFHTRKRLLADGSMLAPGVQFNVLSDESKSHFIDYFCLNVGGIFEGWSAEEWCTYWFSKLAKSNRISSMFAHKEFVQELEY